MRKDARPARTLADLPIPTLAEMQAERRATPKGLPHQLVKAEQQKTKARQEKDWRQAVWRRDQGRSRATGRPLVKSGTTDWTRLGEADHAIPRSLAPERLYDVENGLLLSKEENRLRKVACPGAPEFRLFDYTGPANRGKKQHFVWRDPSGRITRQRTG